MGLGTTALVTAEDCVASIKRWAVKDAMAQKVMAFVSHLGSTAPDQRSQRSVALWNISPGRQCSFMRQSLIRTRQALSRGPFAIYRNTGWGLEVLFIEGVNGERVEVAEINTWCERACVCAQELLRKKQKGEKIERPREHARSNVVNLTDALR